MVLSKVLDRTDVIELLSQLMQRCQTSRPGLIHERKVEKWHDEAKGGR